MAELKKNEPTADVLMNSMRSMGYSFESAIADIIDNSISAKCHEVRILFPSNPLDCYVAICDDGEGMARDELFEAMRYGSNLKKNGRDLDDLGRFGLGLKSASLSQCRKLTVVSKKDGILSSFCWDLDNVMRECDWSIIEYDQSEINDETNRDFVGHALHPHSAAFRFLQRHLERRVVGWQPECCLPSRHSGNGKTYEGRLAMKSRNDQPTLRIIALGKRRRLIHLYRILSCEYFINIMAAFSILPF